MEKPSEENKSTKPPGPLQVTKELEELLKLPQEMANERVLTWIRGGLLLIRPEQVLEAVQNNVQVVHILFNHVHLYHPLVKPLAVQLFRIFFGSVCYYLLDAQKLYAVLAANPAVQKTLDTAQGRAWIDRCCLYGYITVYNYTWC